MLGSLVLLLLGHRGLQLANLNVSNICFSTMLSLVALMHCRSDCVSSWQGALGMAPGAGAAAAGASPPPRPPIMALPIIEPAIEPAIDEPKVPAAMGRPQPAAERAEAPAQHARGRSRGAGGRRGWRWRGAALATSETLRAEEHAKNMDIHKCVWVLD